MRNYWISNKPWQRFRTLQKTWQRRIRERNMLARVASRDLTDAGMSSAQANFEMNKPFWRE